MNKIGLIFDMDGTLWDSAEGVAIAWNQVIRPAYGEELCITTEDMKGVMGLPMDALAEKLFPELSGEEQDSLLSACVVRENDYLRERGGQLYPGLEETLARLSESYPLFIVSNCQSGYIEAFLDHYGFWKYFRDIECFGNNSRQKEENIRLIMERNGLTGALYVGDIDKDYRSALKAGVGFIHAAYGFGKIEEEVPRILTIRELPEALCRILVSEEAGSRMAEEEGQNPVTIEEEKIMTELTEKQVSSEEIFEGTVLHVFKDIVSLPNGKEAERELIRHIGAVCIIPVTADNKVIMEHQYRYPISRVVFEIPAGKLDSRDEDRLEAAKRELREETGLVAGEWVDMGLYYPAPAYSDEKITMYLARDLKSGERDLDEDEFIETTEVPLSELVEEVMSGQISDGKTQIMVLKAARYLGI